MCPKGKDSAHLDPFETCCINTINSTNWEQFPEVLGSPDCWQNTPASGSAGREILGENPPSQPDVSSASPQTREVHPHYPNELVLGSAWDRGLLRSKIFPPLLAAGWDSHSLEQERFETAPRTEKRVDGEKTPPTFLNYHSIKKKPKQDKAGIEHSHSKKHTHSKNRGRSSPGARRIPHTGIGFVSPLSPAKSQCPPPQPCPKAAPQPG